LSYQWVDHTAEVELLIEAATEQEVFAEALRALAELIGDGPSRESESLEVAVSAPDRGTLLARWLDELVYRAEAGDFVPDAVERMDLSEDRLEATVRGHRGAPPHLVKGATYHRLGFVPGDRGFRATVVLDV
jgi:SHS2 domain-containing protein